MNPTNSENNQRLQGGIIRIDSKCHIIYKGVNTVGRNKTAVVNIKNLNVSQHHALIILVDDSQHFLVDMNSYNGTFIGNLKLIPYQLYKLTTNAEVKFGDVTAVYLKVSSNNTTLNVESLMLETQNVTQNFYASNTQLMDSNESVLEHSYGNINRTTTEIQSVIQEDIHEIETQQANFPQHLNSHNMPCEEIRNEVVTEEEIISDIHDAPTQAFEFPSVIPSKENNISNNYFNIHDAPTQLIPNKENQSPSLSDKQDSNSKQDESHPNRKSSNENLSATPDSQASSGTIILNDNLTGMCNIASEYRSGLSSPGPSISQINKSMDDSFMNNSKNLSTMQSSVIEETVIEENPTQDHIINNPFEENKENIEIPVKSKSQNSELFCNRNNVTSRDNESDSDTDIESNCVEETKLRKLNGKEYKHVSLSNDSDSETTQDIIMPKKKPVKKLSSLSDSETDIDETEEGTQEIGFLKKPIQKLESDDETNTKDNSDVEHNSEGSEDLLNQLRSDDIEEEVSTRIDEGKSDTQLTTTSKNNSQNSKLVEPADFDDDMEENTNEVKAALDESAEKENNKLINVDEKLNESDCIPATQDAFAEAFNYASQAGKSSSTEDFRLGLTQLMDDSQPSASKRSQPNIIAEERTENDDKKREKEDEKVTDMGDEVYIMPTQPVGGNLKDIPSTSKSHAENDEYLMPTQILPSTSSKGGKNINEDTARKTDKTSDCAVIEENDYDPYMCATQPLEVDSQFKVPKAFTFKKKTAILEKSLNSLLGDERKEDEICESSTQKMDKNPIDDIYDIPTQTLSDIVVHKESGHAGDIDNDLYFQPTQPLEENPQNEKADFEAESFSVDKDTRSSENVIVGSGNEMSTQQELELCTTSNSCLPDKERPDNPLAQVLNEECNTEEFTVPLAVTRARRKSASPLPEHPEHKRTRKSNKNTSPSTSKKTDENLLETICENENVAKNTDIDTVHTETLSQIEAFIKQPIVHTFSNTRLSRSVAQSKIRESENPMENKKSCVVEQNTESLSQIEAFIKQPMDRTYSEPSKSINGSKNSSTKNVSKNTEAGADEDTVETLSQIEAFIKEPVVRTYSSLRASRRITQSKNEPVYNSTPSNSKDQEMSNAEDQKSKKPMKRAHGKEIMESLSKKNETDSELSHPDDSEERGDTFDEQNLEVKSDVDQSFALLESKATKSRKKNVEPVLEEFKVKVTSHRTSMGIAETSTVMPKKSRRITASASSAEEGKQKNKTESDSSDSVAPKKRATRGRPKKGESTSTNNETEEKSRPTRRKTVSKQNLKYTESTSKDLEVVLTRQEIETKDTTRNTSKDPEKINNQKGKRKITEERSSSDNNSSADISTPKKQRNVSSLSIPSSAERVKRKLKPKVVFTMLDSPHLESLIRQLGGTIVDTVNSSTVLVTEHVKRSLKLLAAVGQGKPICSPQWIKDSKRTGEFLDPWEHILIDNEAETKWQFSLKESIRRASTKKLLSDYTFQIMTTSGTDVLKGAIEACGGKCVSKAPAKTSETNFVVVASPDQRNKYSKITKQNPHIKVVEPEAIFDGVLRQELRLSNHLLT